MTTNASAFAGNPAVIGLIAVRPVALRPRLLPGLPSGERELIACRPSEQRVGVRRRLQVATLCRLYCALRTVGRGNVKSNIMSAVTFREAGSGRRRQLPHL